MKRNRRGQHRLKDERRGANGADRAERSLIADEYSPAVHSAVRYIPEYQRRAFPSGSMC
jgi:hypothetical protein